MATTFQYSFPKTTSLISTGKLADDEAKQEDSEDNTGRDKIVEGKEGDQGIMTTESEHRTDEVHAILDKVNNNYQNVHLLVRLFDINGFIFLGTIWSFITLLCLTPSTPSKQGV